MQYNVKMYKIVCGDTVMGNYDEENKVLRDVVTIQAIPASGGVQLALLPFGFPYEEEISGSIDQKHFVYEYKLPEELKTKYLEAKSSIKLTSGLGGGNSGGSGIIL